MEALRRFAQNGEETLLLMEKSLDKLNRMELLQLLLNASETNDALRAENANLRESAERQRRRFPQAAKVGSIAEAALQANRYFDAAQRAADDYLREIKRLRDQVASQVESSQAEAPASAAPVAGPDAVAARASLQQVPQTIQQPQQVNAQAYIQDAQVRANEILGQANAQAQVIVSQARTRSDAMVASARTQSESIVAEANQQAHAIIAQANRRADALIESAGRKAASSASSTGPLGRRGRHVKLSDGAVA